MNTVEALADRFDSVIYSIKVDYERPTTRSISHINEMLGIKIPESMVAFSKAAKKYQNWLGGLGRDYSDGGHIIAINKYAREREECAEFPRNLVIINQGYDDDFDCIDLSTFDQKTGEYQIRYWCPGQVRDYGKPANNFLDYIENHIKHWEIQRHLQRNKKPNL